MGGSLSSPNLIKDVYKSLVFRKTDNKFYYDSKNNSTDIFSVDYAGVLKFKTQGSAPTAVTGGLYFDGTSIYLGQSS